MYFSGCARRPGWEESDGLLQQCGACTCSFGAGGGTARCAGPAAGRLLLHASHAGAMWEAGAPQPPSNTVTPQPSCCTLCAHFVQAPLLPHQGATAATCQLTHALLDGGKLTPPPSHQRCRLCGPQCKGCKPAYGWCDASPCLLSWLGVYCHKRADACCMWREFIQREASEVASE